MQKKIVVTTIVVFLLIVLPIVSFYFLKHGEKLRAERLVPDFEFSTHLNEKISGEKLHGKVYAANFIFSRCIYLCPELQDIMKGLQDEFGDRDDFQLITYTIDPEHDNKEILGSMAREAGARDGVWHFVTGDREDIYRLILGGYLAKVQFNDGQPQNIHPGPKIVLVDKQGYIHGYYGEKEKHRNKITEAVRELLEKDFIDEKL